MGNFKKYLHAERQPIITIKRHRRVVVITTLDNKLFNNRSSAVAQMSQYLLQNSSLMRFIVVTGTSE